MPKGHLNGPNCQTQSGKGVDPEINLSSFLNLKFYLCFDHLDDVTLPTRTSTFATNARLVTPSGYRRLQINLPCTGAMATFLGGGISDSSAKSRIDVLNLTPESY